MDSPVLSRTNPGQPVTRADVGGDAYATAFIFIEPTNGALKNTHYPQ